MALWLGTMCLAFLGTTNAVSRPEVTLLEVLGQPFAATEGVSEECLEHSALYLTALGAYTPWALKMYDASAKIPPGVIAGNYKQLGAYDECLRIESGHGFIGQSCSATVQFVIPEDAGTAVDYDMKDLLLSIALASGLSNWTARSSVLYEWMWCVPSSCNYSEISETLDMMLDPLRVEGRLDVDVSMGIDSCHTAKTDERRLETADWLYVALLLFFTLIVITSTTYDMMKHRTNQEGRKDTRHTLLTSFSLHANGKILLNTKRRENAIGCLDGLRYISICWIIYGHGYYLQVVGVQLDLTRVHSMHENPSNLLVLNANIVTDTFFLLSGILLAYTEFSQKINNPDKSLNILRLYLHRYLRLTPAYAMVIGFYATLYYKIGTGPHWDTWVGANRDYCRQNWWTNLIYVNNFVNVADMCMSQSWYLAVDMQLLWLSPIFLYPMLKFSKSIFVWVILGVGLVFSTAIPFAVTYVMELTGTMLYYKDQTDVANVFLQIYIRTYARAGPYIIGLGMGYLLCKTRCRSLNLSTTYVAVGWLVSIICGLSAVFGPRGMYYDDHTYNKIESSFYAALHRPVFALAVSWIIFACAHGYAGPVNRLLSWRAWMPLSKLTYSAYLSHYLILYYNSGTIRTPDYLSTYNTVHKFFGNLVLTMVISVVIAICFELPFMTIDRALSSYMQKSTAKSSPGNIICKSTENIVSTVSQIDTNTAYNSRTDISGAGYYDNSSVGLVLPKSHGETVEDCGPLTLVGTEDFDNDTSGRREGRGIGRTGCENSAYVH